jgi:hypothetical protein
MSSSPQSRIIRLRGRVSSCSHRGQGVIGGGLLPGGLRHANEIASVSLSPDVADAACSGSAAIQHLALILSLRGERHRAARLAGYVDATYQKLGSRREPTEEWGYNKLLTSLREEIASDEIETLMAEGAGWTEDQTADEALTLSQAQSTSTEADSR